MHAWPTHPRALAAALAPCCRELREAVLRALAVPGSRLRDVAGAWGGPRVAEDDAGLADAYAQLVTCALLVARTGGGARGLLGRVLVSLAELRETLAEPLERLERTLAEVDPDVMRATDDDPWRCFYEAFLSQYDPTSRDEAGAYYTPVEVVHAQVTLVRELLERSFEKGLGFADPEVRTLDPACGTGTYSHYIITSTLARIRDRQGEEAVAEGATRLGANLAALEIMVGPYAVAHMRLTEVLLKAGARLPPEGAQVFLCDTLESSHARAAEGRVLVCIGNPPYDRQERGGERGRAEPGSLTDFLPAHASGAGKHAKNLYNQYVYFWRWALSRVFERSGEGIVCFVTASSFLRGPGFVTMRRHMREILGELWIVDIGGDALGPRRSANVFSITTPVCITVALRRGGPNREVPATVRYCRLPDGLDRAQKLGRLGRLRSLDELGWQRAPEGWEDPFVPGAVGGYTDWPRLDELCPWQHSGAQWKRTWPVAETPELLARRWRALMAAEDRRELFRESESWTVGRVGAELFAEDEALAPIGSLARTAPVPRIVRYGWRALDRQWCLADGRLGDRLRPVLWQIQGERQIYLTTLMSTGLSRGPALVASAHVPDLHHFRGSFGDRGVIPLWRDRSATEANVTAGLLEFLEQELGVTVGAEALCAYVYGCLGHPGYTEALADVLAEPGPRVPITARAELFGKMVALGRELLRLHTFGERMNDRAGRELGGRARCLAAIPGDEYPATFEHAGETLRVGAGSFAPVSKEVWDYEVSGFKIVRAWLGFRMQEPRGRKSSPLDDIRPERWTDAMTHELLELLWVLERSLAIHGEQRVVFEAIVAGPLVSREALPRPRAGQEKPPRRRGGRRPVE